MKIYVKIITLALSIILGACSEKTTAVSIAGYNHMKDLAIAQFYINGIMGPGASAEGGGAESCCISLPKVWRPGLTVKIWWEFDGFEGQSIPPPPRKEISVAIPEYRFASRLQVHFYRNEVKVVVSPCSPEHPFYPMTKEELMPWKAFGSKQSMIETAKRGGGTIDC